MTILLVQTAEGDTVGIRFSSFEEARAWEDEHEYDVLGVGAVRLVGKREALKLSRR